MINIRKINRGIIYPCTCIIFTSCLMMGCKTDNSKYFEDGYFRCLLIENKYIAITGLTDLGLEQNSIDIPREINGFPVHELGTQYMQRKGDLNLFEGYERKIYTFENIRNIYANDETIFYICSEKITGIVNTGPNTFYSRYLNDVPIGFDYDCIRFANVTFLDEKNNINKVYRIENIENGQKIPEPPTPIKEDYVFLGWCKEPDCINKVDFNVLPTIAEDTELVFYANWQQK